MKRLVLALAALTLAVAASASAAWAHEEISPGSVPTGRPVFLTLSAANERSADLNRVTITVPDGLSLGHSVRETPGWTASVSGSTVTWSGGAVGHDRFEQWGFEIDGPDQPGTRTFRVTLGYSDGSTDDSEVPLTVVAASGVGGSQPGVTAAASTTVTTAGGTTDGGTSGNVAAPGSGEGTGEDGGGTGGGGQGRATLALVLSSIALVAAIAAAVLASRRAPSSRPVDAPAQVQDW